MIGLAIFILRSFIPCLLDPFLGAHSSEVVKREHKFAIAGIFPFRLSQRDHFGQRYHPIPTWVLKRYHPIPSWFLMSQVLLVQPGTEDWQCGRVFHLKMMMMKMVMMLRRALAQIPISTFSHIWVFVRQYGVMFVIIVIIIIIIIIYRKVKVSTLKHV